MQPVYTNVYMKTVKIDCTGNLKYVYENYTCRLRAINRYKTVGMMEVQPLKPLRNISFNLALYIRNDANIFKPFLVNITENLCKWYARRSPGAYIAILMKVLQKYTNINHSCPYTGPIIARNLYLDMSIIPVQLPKNSYKIHVIFYESIEQLGTVTYYMDLIETQCSGNLKYVYGNHTCRLKAINRFKSVGMMEVYIREQLRNITFNMGFFVRNSANVFKPYLFNVTENICKWYNQRSPGAYTNILMKTLKKFTNVNHTCPYTGPLIAKNLYLDVSIIPIPLPKGSYKILVVFYEGINNTIDHIGTPIYSKVYMKTVKIECFGNLKYVYDNHSCRLKPINRFKTIGIMEVHARIELRNISFNMALFARNSANIYKPFLFNVTENLCSWYRRRTPGAYSNMLMKILKHHTNLNHSCPYKGPIIADNLYVDVAVMPIPFPKNSYKFNVVFYEGLQNVQDHIGTVIYYMDTVGMMEVHARIELRNISFNLALFARNSANIFKPYLFNVTTNVCKWFVHRTPGAYANVLMNVLKQYTNINHSCPYIGPIIARNLYLVTHVGIIPVPFPKNSYKFNVIFYEGQEQIGTVYNFALFARNSANIFKPYLFNVTTNVCKWLDHRSPGAYSNILMNILKQYTNINHSCPYIGPIIAKNLYLDVGIIPVPFPRNSYKFNVIFYEGLQNVQDYIGTVVYYMDLIETRH
ncbi:hypothetical protein CVS40_1781 [Lucilia cuprina]|nr:hypothetical protein CVS40_1781 [Lucilia cuprina]